MKCCFRHTLQYMYHTVYIIYLTQLTPTVIKLDLNFVY